MRTGLMLALILVHAAAIAQDAAIRFTGIAPGAEPAAFAVNPGAALPLPFTVTQGASVEIFVPPFLGEGGDVLALQPSVADAPGATVADQRVSFTAWRPAYTLALKVPNAPMAGKYAGQVIVTLQGREPQVNRLVLTRAAAQRPAKLVLDTKSSSVYQEGFGSSPASFRLTLRNAAGEWPAEGVYLRLLDVTAPAGANFDAARNLQLTWNGQPAADLWHSAARKDAARTIGPNQQADIGGTLEGLSPGEYTVKVGVGAESAAPDSEQQATLKLFVKHGPVLPLLVLLAAIALSYLATKGLEAQRRRAAQLRKIEEIRPSWLREEPPTLPVVATRALLKQVENRNRDWFDALFGQDATSTAVAKSELLLRILARVRRIRSRIRSSDWNSMTRTRANKRLEGIAGSINPDTVDENTAKQVDVDLDALEKWFDPTLRAGLYRQDLASAMENLAAQVRLESFTEAQRPVVARLLDVIRAKADSPPDLARLEESYAKLKILWERKVDDDDEALGKLMGLLAAESDASIEKFFRLGDDLAWERLAASEFRFTAPDTNQADPLQAFQLIQFEVAPLDPRDGKNYLFKHKLDYEWSLVLGTEDGYKLPLAQPRTNEPRLVQFIPAAGTLYVSVTLWHGNRSSRRTDRDPLKIGKSSDFGWRSAFRFNEMTALGISTAFAVVSGLATFYFGKHGFGSAGDYISLFLWGAGVDQTKTFLQNLEKTSGPAT